MKRFLLPALMSIVLVMPINAQYAIIADAMRSLPVMPTVDQIITPEAKQAADKSVYAPYKQAVEQYMLTIDKENIELNARMERARTKQVQRNQQTMQQYNRNVSAGLMPSQEEMMQVLMSSGVNLEKASDEQIMDIMAGTFAKKWGISKEEYIKIINMAQRNPKQTETYLQTNHPDLYKRLYAANYGCKVSDDALDARDERFGQIGEELSSLLEKLTNAIQNYPGMNNNIESYEEKWRVSAEGKQVNDIEEQLWKRVEQWESGLSVGSSGFADVPYPGWWTAERKKENALIDQWNRRNAEQWLKQPVAYHQELKAIFERIAALETENEQLGAQGNPDNAIYLANKQRLLTFRGQLLQLIMPYSDALDFPCVEKYEESGSIHLGKG